jgi:Tol biopolymer transport system component
VLGIAPAARAEWMATKISDHEAGSMTASDGPKTFDLSPDGRWVVFPDRETPRIVSVSLVDHQRYDLTEGIPEEYFAKGIEDYRIAPDNEHVMFQLDDHLYLAELDAGERRLVTDRCGGVVVVDTIMKSYFDFIPDGRMIYRTDDGQLIVESLDGATSMSLNGEPTDTAKAFNFRSTPDGETIAFMSGSESGTIAIVNTDGTGHHVLTDPPGVKITSVVGHLLSGDGKKIVAFARTQTATTPTIAVGIYSNAQIVGTNLTDNVLQALTPPLESGKFLADNIQISPGGEYVSYLINSAGSNSLYVVPLAGGTPVPISSQDGPLRFNILNRTYGLTDQLVGLVQSPYQGFISARYDGTDVARMQPDREYGLGARRVEPTRGYVVSEAMGRIFYIAHEGDGPQWPTFSLVSADVVTGEAFDLIPDLEGLVQIIAPDPDEPYIYTTTTPIFVSDPVTTLYRMNAWTGERETLLVGFENPTGSSASFGSIQWIRQAYGNSLIAASGQGDGDQFDLYHFKPPNEVPPTVFSLYE